MSFLQQHWALIAANPWLFASWILLVAGLTWTVIHFLYRHRLELYRHRGEEDAAEIKRLRDRLSELKEGRAGAANEPSVGIPLPVLSGKYEYSDAGDHGLNILGQTLAELVVNQTYSMAAKVPDNGFLKISSLGHLLFTSTSRRVGGHITFRQGTGRETVTMNTITRKYLQPKAVKLSWRSSQGGEEKSR